MNILRVRCQGGEEFRALYQSDQPGGGIFCPTTKRIEPNTSVVVELICKDLPNRVLIRAVVVSWRPALPRLRVRAGAVTRFCEGEEAKRDFVLETLGGKRRTPGRRKHARVPVGLPATVRLDGGALPIPAELREISVTGALLACSADPPIGADVVLEVVNPKAEAPIQIAGRVLYKAPGKQFGVRFLFREGGGSRRLRELVRRFKSP